MGVQEIVRNARGWKLNFRFQKSLKDSGIHEYTFYIHDIWTQ